MQYIQEHPYLKLLGNTSNIGSVVSLYALEMAGAASITKGDLTPIYDNQFGFVPSVLSGSYGVLNNETKKFIYLFFNIIMLYRIARY